MIETAFRLGVLILGAGRSVRMGQPKLLLPWSKATILGHLLSQWQKAGAAQVIVAYAEQDLVMLAEFDRLGVAATDRVANPITERGMFSSIVCAAQSPNWQPALTHFAIVLGDQPHLRLNTLVTLVAFAERHPEQVCQPVRNGRRHHPVILPKHFFLELGCSSFESLKEFLAGRDHAGVDCDDPGLELDIDRPEDYERALALAGLSRC